MTRCWIRRAGLAAMMGAAGLGTHAVAQDNGPSQPAAAVPAVKPVPWLQMVEEREGAVLQLQLAVREFTHPDPDRPVVTIAGAAHIGEREYYAQLQEILDEQDVVLYEGVKPRSAGAVDQSDDAQVALTRSRMRVLWAMLDAYRRERGEYPQTLAELLDVWPDAKHAENPTDAWGNTLIYLPGGDDEPGFEIMSLGADGAEGGEGAAAEIRMSDAETPPAQPRRPEGIQKQMADAMGLVFQLDAMDNTSPHWRNSDMTLEELRERFAESGVEAERLFGLLDGSSLMGRFSGLLLGLLGSNDQSRAMLKAVMIEILSRADRLMAQMPGDAAAMMAVIVDERNEIVLADLERLLDDEPHVRTVGIIYGAGHLAHLERRLTVDLGYVPGNVRWLTAMHVDTEEAGIPPAQLKTMRQMIQRSLEAQTQRRRQR